MAAETTKTLDITKPISELLASNPELKDTLSELDITIPDTSKTLPELAHELGIGIPIIAMALEAAGYTVEGYSGDMDQDAPAFNPLPDLVARVFGVDHQGNPLPEPDFSKPDMCSQDTLAHNTSPDTLYLHMEDAIRIARDEGKLPKNPKQADN